MIGHIKKVWNQIYIKLSSTFFRQHFMTQSSSSNRFDRWWLGHKNTIMLLCFLVVFHFYWLQIFRLYRLYSIYLGDKVCILVMWYVQTMIIICMHKILNHSFFYNQPLNTKQLFIVIFQRRQVPHEVFYIISSAVRKENILTQKPAV